MQRPDRSPAQRALVFVAAAIAVLLTQSALGGGIAHDLGSVVQAADAALCTGYPDPSCVTATPTATVPVSPTAPATPICSGYPGPGCVTATPSRTPTPVPTATPTPSPTPTEVATATPRGATTNQQVGDYQGCVPLDEWGYSGAVSCADGHYVLRNTTTPSGRQSVGYSQRECTSFEVDGVRQEAGCTSGSGEELYSDGDPQLTIGRSRSSFTYADGTVVTCTALTRVVWDGGQPRLTRQVSECRSGAA
jgi:hypothetical protein